MENTIFPHKFWRPFLDCMPQLFFRPKYVWFPVHLKGRMIPNPGGQLAELIVWIISTRVDLYSHQILFKMSSGPISNIAQGPWGGQLESREFSYIYLTWPWQYCVYSLSRERPPVLRNHSIHCSHDTGFLSVYIFSCDQAALQMVFSVCLSVRPSVRLSHLIHHVPIIVSSWNFQELLPWSKVMSMQKVKVIGQRSRSQRSTPNLAVSGL